MGKFVFTCLQLFCIHTTENTSINSPIKKLPTFTFGQKNVKILLKLDNVPNGFLSSDLVFFQTFFYKFYSNKTDLD